MRKKQIEIYSSHKHLLITLLVIVVPFLLLLVFARVGNIEYPRLFLDIGHSAFRIFVAYVGATLIALLLAVSFYRGRRSSISLPFFDVLQNIPTFSLLPLAILIWGANNVTVILFLTIIMTWPIFFSILNSLKSIKNDWDEAVRIVDLKGWNYFRYFLAPITIPGLITGSIIALAEGWEAVIAAEIIANIPFGLGDFFQSASNNTLLTLFGILGLLSIVFGINKLFWLPLLEKSYQTMEE